MRSLDMQAPTANDKHQSLPWRHTGMCQPQRHTAMCPPSDDVLQSRPSTFYQTPRRGPSAHEAQIDDTATREVCRQDFVTYWEVHILNMPTSSLKWYVQSVWRCNQQVLYGHWRLRVQHSVRESQRYSTEKKVATMNGSSSVVWFFSWLVPQLTSSHGWLGSSVDWFLWLTGFISWLVLQLTGFISWLVPMVDWFNSWLVPTVDWFYCWLVPHTAYALWESSSLMIKDSSLTFYLCVIS